MANVLRDVLAGTPLPFITQFVMGHAGVFPFAAVLLCVLGIGSLFLLHARGRRIVTATVVIGILFIQWQVIVSAMQSPLTQLISQIGESPK